MATTVATDSALRERIQLALGDGFVLGERLGGGGFAEVYAANDKRLKRRVAVKVLRAGLIEAAGALERFRREAEAVAALRHPNIVPIYAVGDAEGLAYFLMPLYEGGSLAERLAREPRLPVAEARRILQEAAAGLAAAHRAGIVHRDIKPDNMLLDGPERRVVLTDFGIAKALGAGSHGLTQTGAVIGTPLYMSPEQASGERAIDHRADLYSLGVVGYQMLGGQVPFNADNAAAVLVQHLTKDPVLVSRARPDCPPDLARAVMRCLAKAPEDRWSSADDLTRALEAEAPATRATAGAQPRSSAAQALAVLGPIRRFRLVAAGGLVGVALLVAVDVVMQRVLAGPLGAIVAALVIAHEYGRLWTAGFTWRDVLAHAAVPARVASPVPFDSAELGPHRASIQQARNDRAGMLALIQGLPAAERKRLAAVLPTVDALVARAAADARQLFALERQLDPGPEEIRRRLADTRAEPPSPGREQRIAVLERRLAEIGSIVERSEPLGSGLAARLAGITTLRFALDSAIAGGVADGLARVDTAVEEARMLAHEVGLSDQAT